jgi:murein DD-endopeptidase MepM/ murein hydrolase activator NlpD
MRLSRKIGLLTFCACTTLAFTAYAAGDSKISTAEDANVLFKIYNEAQIEDSNELQEAYYELQAQYEDAATDVQQGEIFNKMRDEAVRVRTEQIAEIDSDVNEILSENREIVSNIEDRFNGSWSDLKVLDSSYKMNINKINSLLEQKNKYTIVASRIIDYDKLDELSKEIEDTMVSYQEAAEVKILGNVSNVKFPLGADSLITSSYGDRIDPMTGTSIRFHSGIDLRAKTGTSVLALFNGTVVDTGYGTAGGYYVKVDHGNGIVSYYCHLSEIKCEKGQQVNQYAEIALSGNTGTRTTGPHLHLALYIDGNSVDPAILFNKDE